MACLACLLALSAPISEPATLEPEPSPLALDQSDAPGSIGLNQSELAQESATWQAEVDAPPDLFDLHASSKFSSVYTDYLCVNRGHCSMNPSNAGAKLNELMKNKLPKKAHLLVYGPSYMREIGSALYEHTWPESVNVLGENNRDKTCNCGTSGKKCPCLDYVTFGLRGGSKMTYIINYGRLQTSENHHRLKKTLRTGGFTHGLVMEPHSDCFFNKCHGLGSCGCPNRGDYLSCSWSSGLWSTMQAHFGHKMVNMVPWTVKAHEAVHGPAHLALRTRSIAEAHACEAEAKGSASMSIAKTGVSKEHQCYAVCKTRAGGDCSEGTPVLMALKAMEMLF